MVIPRPPSLHVLFRGLVKAYQMTRDVAYVCCLVSAYFLLFSGSFIHAIDYDYSATEECWEEPWAAQYNGGVIANPDFIKGTQRWTAFGQGKIRHGKTKGGNYFIVASDRKHPTDGFSYKVKLQKGMFYAFSGWFQVNEGSETVSVAFRAAGGEMHHGGAITAQHGCWSMLKGGIVSDFNGIADLVFESNNTSVEIWADNIALQPFTEEQWRSHQDKAIQKARKSIVNFNTIFTNKTKLSGASIIIKQTNSAFPVGTVINKHIIDNAAFQNWVTSRFSVVTFQNELKWYANEGAGQGKEDYTVADAMMDFAEKHKISVRGHNVLWDDPRMQPYWVTNLNPDQLKNAVEKRIESVVNRYKGRLIHWDVVNENLHWRFFEDKLGGDISANVYGKVQQTDPRPIKFMNEYNTIEVSSDTKVNPKEYVRKLSSILKYPGNKNLPAGIGLQTRFAGQPNLVYMRAGLDYLSKPKLPLWLTEVFVNQTQNQAQYLEQVLREGHSHPSVNGIVMWPSIPLDGKCEMCLTDTSFHNTQIGDVVDKVINEWKQSTVAIRCEGSCSVPLYHGDYEVTIQHHEIKNVPSFNVKVTKDTAKHSFQVEMDPHSAKISLT